MAKRKETVQPMRVRGEDNYVHISTMWVADTLCGFNDAPGYELVEEPIDCPGCLRPFNWIKSVELK